MIRREAIGPDGAPCWVLISQIEHARVSGALAACWGADPFVPLPARDELLPAIIRHDDGWSRWEKQPDVDPATGRPRDFTEMPLGDSLVIWRDSIERAATLSELGGYAVAGHFLNLLKQSAAWRQQGTRESAAAHQWAADFEAWQFQWLDEWCGRGGAEHEPAVAEAALARLQFFDRLSLWFCVAQQRQSAEMPTPDGPVLKLIPQSDTAPSGRQPVALGGSPHGRPRVVLDPWPLEVAALEVSITGRRVPERRYSDAAALAAEPQPPVTLWLSLVPAF